MYSWYLNDVYNNVQTLNNTIRHNSTVFDGNRPMNMMMTNEFSDVTVHGWGDTVSNYSRYKLHTIPCMKLNVFRMYITHIFYSPRSIVEPGVVFIQPRH